MRDRAAKPRNDLTALASDRAIREDIEVTMTLDRPGTADQLISSWTSHSWREPMAAPGVAVLQALTKDGQTASGLGATRACALERTLSETAEMDFAAAAGQHGYIAQLDGMAAHPDPAQAQRNAMLEACERRVLLKWWRGDLQSQQIDPAWQSAMGLPQWLEQMRRGAACRRSTRLWCLSEARDLCTIIAQSSTPQGQDMLLGFGTDLTAKRAAAKALREVLLMEINLMELMAVRSGYADHDISRIEDKIALYGARTQDLLPMRGQKYVPHDGTSSFALDSHAFINCGLRSRVLTPPQHARAVWICIDTAAKRRVPGADHHPFL